jgi:hypothetical protein
VMKEYWRLLSSQFAATKCRSSGILSSRSSSDVPHTANGMQPVNSVREGMRGQGSGQVSRMWLQPHEFTPPRCCPNPQLSWSVIHDNGVHDADLANRFASKILPNIRSV